MFLTALSYYVCLISMAISLLAQSDTVSLSNPRLSDTTTVHKYSKRSTWWPAFDCELPTCATQITNIVGFRNNLFIPDLYSRSSGNSEPGIITKLTKLQKDLKTLSKSQENAARHAREERALLRRIAKGRL